VEWLKNLSLGKRICQIRHRNYRSPAEKRSSKITEKLPQIRIIPRKYREKARK
jgi:hypothetical protein